jgi:tetratricopeptide (TPR) repeat protein
MKFKNIKKKIYEKKSPNNSRSITERFKFSLPEINSTNLLKLYRAALNVFLVFIFIAAVIIVGLDLQKNINVKQNIDLQREKLTKELKFWESFIAKHEDYPDAYLQASILEYKLGNASKARINVEKGLSLDPNSQEGLKIGEFLNK